jgi:hypothetical protein
VNCSAGTYSTSPCAGSNGRVAAEEEEEEHAVVARDSRHAPRMHTSLPGGAAAAARQIWSRSSVGRLAKRAKNVPAVPVPPSLVEVPVPDPAAGSVSGWPGDSCMPMETPVADY